MTIRLTPNHDHLILLGSCTRDQRMMIYLPTDRPTDRPTDGEHLEYRSKRSPSLRFPTGIHLSSSNNEADRLTCETMSSELIRRRRAAGRDSRLR